MSRSLSTAARRAAWAQQTDAVFIILVTITHDGLAEPVRVASAGVTGVTTDDDGNPVPYTERGGERYVQYPFRFELPEDRDDQAVTARIEIDNVDRMVVEAVREIQGSPEVTVEVVLSEDPETLEAGPWVFELQSAEYDALTVSGTLGYEPLLSEPYPAHTMSPATMPGIF